MYFWTYFIRTEKNESYIYELKIVNEFKYIGYKNETVVIHVQAAFQEHRLPASSPALEGRGKSYVSCIEWQSVIPINKRLLNVRQYIA